MRRALLGKLNSVNDIYILRKNLGRRSSCPDHFSVIKITFQGSKNIWIPPCPLGKQLSSFACPGHFPACPGFQTPTWIPKRKSFPGVLECSKSVWLVCSLLSVKYFACYFMNYMLIIFSWFFILKPLNQCFQLSKPQSLCSTPWMLNCILPKLTQKIILKRSK